MLSAFEQVPGVMVVGQEKLAMSGHATNAPTS
jgi:hypothetical protein